MIRAPIPGSPKRAVLRRNTPTPESWYSSRQPSENVLAMMRRHDPLVFFRFNTAIGLTVEDCGRWEVWRWRDENPGRPPLASERGNRAQFCFAVFNPDGTFRDIDETTVKVIIEHDTWQQHGRVSTEEEAARMADRIERQDQAEDARTDREIETYADDWARDHRRQINEFFGHAEPIFVMPGKKLVTP